MKKIILVVLVLTFATPAFAKKPQREPQYQGICWEFAGYKICLN